MYTLILTATSTASANGSDTNTATAILMNDGQYVSGKAVEFRLVSGNAIFSDGTQIIKVTTNALGQASVEYTDTVEETISVMAIMADDASVYSITTSSFKASTPTPGPLPTLEVTRIYNDNNKNFEIGGPHHLFIGATFYIEISEPSPSTIWTCDDVNVQVKNVNGLGHVSIKGTPISDVIQIKFSNASGSGEYDIACNLYLDNVHAGLNKAMPTSAEYIAIYGEWGDMTTFGWGKASGAYYYYAFHSILSGSTVDMTDGQKKVIGLGSCSYASKQVLSKVLPDGD
ncbi:Ig-like domain-containing protein [Lonsdalea quercina]|uniref:Big-1 domain-containing protein n=1 Tax=Lonsdalea quercina TaxID=71657 RepID=A0A1H3ZGT1_9GAMM|nr:Ig-like domain-containing protein [Lonsdalea quercina]SEA22880.1 hypothetical protein SAMN02982996_01180 [Lonsdalea quercina]